MTDAAAPQDIAAADMDWVHALNQAHGEELSFVTPPHFAQLVERACYARVIQPAAAFLLAFDRRPTDDSPNYDWFADRRENFLYIDRIAVDAAARKLGCGRRLYGDLFDFARARGFATIGCEVNADPPNPASDAFHARLGFREVGEARLADRGKTVRYFEVAL